MSAIRLPTLIVVSGPPGSGKTTLAHELARALGCPAICRDEIKEGMARSDPDFKPAPGDALTQRTLRIFLDVLGLLLGAGVTVVAEAASQDKVWRPNLEPLLPVAELRIIQCRTEPNAARDRILHRPGRAAHADTEFINSLDKSAHTLDSFEWISISAPTIQVDTTDGYVPDLEEIVSSLSND